MAQTLLDAVRQYTEANAGPDGIARTRIPGLNMIREVHPTPLQYAISKPLVALVLQGSKRVTAGSKTIEFSAGQSLLITADVPTVSQITQANLSEPYLGLAIDLAPDIIESLVAEMRLVQAHEDVPMQADMTDAEVADSALRLLCMLNRPATLPMLQNQLLRELHYWLLMGRHGGGIQRLGINDSHAQRIGRAVAYIRENFAQPVRVEQLAEKAGMSASSFHEHFRSTTSLTPLQFQKQLRLIHARRMMLADGERISIAAYGVGYESVPQFTREYSRLFGAPPARDMKDARARAEPIPPDDAIA